MEEVKVKDLVWMGDSLKNLRKFDDEVKDEVGYSLHEVQEGVMPKNAKPLKGFKPAVMEIVCNYDSNTYRAIYTVKIGTIVYVLHCFQKKSKRGSETPKQEIDLIQDRLLMALKVDVDMKKHKG